MTHAENMWRYHTAMINYLGRFDADLPEYDYHVEEEFRWYYEMQNEADRTTVLS